MSGREASRPSLVHPAYRHLERAPRLAGLTLGQWSGLVAAAAGAYALTLLLPFSATYNLSVATTLIGVPLVVAMTANASGGVNIVTYVIAVASWRRHAGLYVPGEQARPPAGYQLCTGAPEERPRRLSDGPSCHPRWEDLWR